LLWPVNSIVHRLSDIVSVPVYIPGLQLCIVFEQNWVKKHTTDVLFTRSDKFGEEWDLGLGKFGNFIFVNRSVAKGRFTRK